MKNPTQDEKDHIIKVVRELLDRRDVEIHFQLSREMRQLEPDKDATVATFEPTNALVAVVAVQSMPALKWADDLAAEEKIFQRVRQLPARWSGINSTDALTRDLRTFIPELFEEETGE